MLVREYGAVEADGAAGHHSARIVLRAPRIAVRVESGRHWQSMFALAMWAAAGRWGGYGFIYIPRGRGKLHPALARVLRAYDPDYLVDALWTHGDIEALESGWHARHYKGWPTDSGESARMLSHLADQVVREGPGEDIGANLCSPYYEIEDSRPMRVLLPDTGRAEHSLATVLGGTPRADFEVPAGLDPLLTLALGMRAGYTSKPPLPLGREADGVTARFPAPLVSYVLSTGQDRTASELGGLTTAWDLTKTGLVKIFKMLGPPARPVVVVGSAAEDFALAVALDRMSGPTLWVPVEWVRDSGLRWPVQYGYDRLSGVGHSFGRPPIVTSISLSREELSAVVQATWPPCQPSTGTWRSCPPARQLPAASATSTKRSTWPPPCNSSGTATSSPLCGPSPTRPLPTSPTVSIPPSPKAVQIRTERPKPSTTPSGPFATMTPPIPSGGPPISTSDPEIQGTGPPDRLEAGSRGAQASAERGAAITFLRLNRWSSGAASQGDDNVVVFAADGQA